MPSKKENVIRELTANITKIISETNGISLDDTLELAGHSLLIKESPTIHKLIVQFRYLLARYQQDELDIDTLMVHPVAHAIYKFFERFPLRFQEEHIHLTGSLSAEFIYPRLKKLLEGPKKKVVEQKIIEVYGEEALPIKSVEDVDRLIRLQEDEHFDRYLEILLLPKLILTSKQAHKEAAYSMAETLYRNYNVGRVRLKFSFSRASAKEADAIPGIEKLTSEDVVMGLYEGFTEFQKKNKDFDFILSPSFRKESHFYNPKTHKDKKSAFEDQVEEIFALLKKYPQLKEKMNNVDTVGNERDLYRKSHFEHMRVGLRRLQFRGFKIRSHHGETWHTLKKGVQAVDNAMNIWHIDTLEHGLSLGINPNFYFHMMFERVMAANLEGRSIKKKTSDYDEIMDMDWMDYTEVRNKLIKGTKLTQDEIKIFIKIKFFTAREIEHYQHDVLNRMIHKDVSLIALPSSNQKLTYFFPDFKDHPFSWWEKKGVSLGVGTDNYITLSTDFIKEMLILLFLDSQNLKITKLLMVVTGETRRPYISHLLWEMRQEYDE